MRVMIKFALPVDSSNTAIRTGKLAKIMHQITAGSGLLLPHGRGEGWVLRRRYAGSSQIADMAERFFFGLNTKVEFVLVMSAVDLEKGLSTVQGTIERYA